MAVTTKPLFDDEDYCDRLTKLLAFDVTALKQCASMLGADDFKPLDGHRWGRPRWITAERTLEFFKQQREPVGKLLRVEVLHYANKLNLGERQVQELEEYLKHLRTIPVTSPTAIIEKVVFYKEQRLRAGVLEEMIELQASGQLTSEVWQQLTQKALHTANGYHAISYFETVEERIARRTTHATTKASRVPIFYIDPLDQLVRGVGPGQLGLIIAPTGRGKSLAMIWLAISFAMQNLNVLLVSLEDPGEEVESRLDSATTAIPVLNLPQMPNRFRSCFNRFRDKWSLGGRLRVVDGTQDAMGVEQIDQLVQRERERGFRTDVLLVDYDEYIVPAVRHKEHRFDSDEIYIGMHRMASRRDLILWMAAQTQRNTANMKILSGDRVAEDIGKIRKTTMAIGIGKGEWGDNSFYLWVDKHKYDHSKVGCHIVPDLPKMLFYDPSATRKAALQYERQTTVDEEGL